MRKSIARKLAGLLAAIVLTSTFASDYNSIGARASEVTEITDETLEAEGVNEGSEEESAPENLEAEGPVVEEEETVVEAETPVEEETPAAEETVVADEGSTEEVSEETGEGSTEEVADAANEGTTEETADAANEGATEEAADAATEEPADDAVVEEPADAANTATTENTEEAPEKEERVKEFKASEEIGGILVSLYADPEVLPDDAVLDIKAVEANVEEQIKNKVEENIESTTNEDVEVETSSYDINIYSESHDGFVQPEDGTVEVRFSQIEKAADGNVDLAVYHVEDNLSNVSKVADAATDTAQEVTFNAEHFSIYTVSLSMTKTADPEEIEVPFIDRIVNSAVFDGPEVEAEETEYIINFYKGSQKGKYSKKIWFSLDSSSDIKYEGLTVKEMYGKAYVGQPFAPAFPSNATMQEIEYFLDDEAEGSILELDEASADSKKNVLNVYYYSEGDIANVAFYIRLPQYPAPASSVIQEYGEYYPGKFQDYSYEKWSGTAYDLYELESHPSYNEIADNIDGIHNLWDPEFTGKIDKVITSIPTTDINSDFLNEDILKTITISDDKGCTRPAEWSDIKWYVYKNVAGDTSGDEDPEKQYHIDGYVHNADISVTYYANYPECDEPVIVHNVRTGHNYTIQKYADTFKNAYENYEFAGWAECSDPGENDKIRSEGESVFLLSSAEFYAQWKLKEFKTEYFDEDQTTLISSNETAKPEAVRQAYGDTTYTIDDPASKTDEDGYVRQFVGWIGEDGQLHQRSEIANTTVTGNQKFIAKYESVSRNKNYYVNYYFQKADGTYDDASFEPAKLTYKDGKYVSDYMDSEDKEISVPVGQTGAFVEVKPDKAVTRKIGTDNIDYTLVNNQVNEWSDTVYADETRVVVLKVYYKRADFDADLTVRAITTSLPYDGKKQNSTTATYDTDSTLAKTYDITVVANVDNDGITHVDEAKAGNKKVTKVTLNNKANGETFVLDATKLDENGYIIDSRFKKIKVIQGTFSITPVNVKLMSWSLKKEFDGTALTNDDRAKYAIGLNVAEGEAVPELKTNTGWIEGEGATFTFTGSQTLSEDSPSANSFEYTLKSNTKACDYNIDKQEGDLIVESRSEKYEIIIKLATEKEEDGLDTYVYYQGVDMKANMAVDVTVNTEVIKNAMKNAGLISSLKEGLGNVLDSALGSMTINASAEENAEIVNIDPVVKEVTDKLSVTVSGMYLTGGHGTKVGVYPIYLHTKDLNISMTLDGKTQNITDQFKLTVIKHETGVKVESPLDLEADNENADTLEADPTEIIGNLHVLKREVVLTSGSASKIYDGTPLTEPTVTASELGEKTGFVHGEGANFNVTGTITDPGSVANTFTYALYDGSVEGQPATDIGNYDITTVEGTLTVTKDTEVPDKDDKKKKKKDKDPDDDEKIPNDNVDDDPDEGGSTNQGSVLGEKRPAETPATEEPAVLGARRGGTEDNTNTARVLVLIFAAGAAVSLMAVGKRKKEENE
jgi:hypothetical protein